MRANLLGALGLLLLCAVAVLSALLEVLLVPLRDGTWLVPVAVLFALAGNVALPRLARAFVDTTAAMAAAFLSWLLPVLILALTPRPEGDVLIRAGAGEQWVFYGVLLGGAVAGTATLVLHGAPRPGSSGPAARLPTPD